MAYREENLTFEEVLSVLNTKSDTKVWVWNINGFPIVLAQHLPENITVDSTFITKRPDTPYQLVCLYHFTKHYMGGGICVLCKFSGPEEITQKYPELSEVKGTLLIP